MYSLTPSRSADGHSLARGNWKPIIQRAIKDPVRVGFITKCISRVVKYEIQKFCSDKVSSILRDKTADAIRSFTWETVLKEAEAVMPVLIEVLRTCTIT